MQRPGVHRRAATLALRVFLIGFAALLLATSTHALPALLPGLVWVAFTWLALADRSLPLRLLVPVTALVFVAVGGSAFGVLSEGNANRFGHGATALGIAVACAHLVVGWLEEHRHRALRAAVIGVALTLTLGVMVEFLEAYHVATGGHADGAVFWDTIYDFAADAVGAVIGGMLWCAGWLIHRRRRDRR